MKENESQDDQQEVQRVVAELREAQQNVESLQSHIEMLSSLIGEVESTRETVDGLEDVEPGTEILVPLGSGTYVTAEIKSTDKLLSELGADLVAERSSNGVNKLLKKQKKDFENSLEQAQNKLKELTEKIEDLRPRAQKLLAESRGTREENVRE